MSDAPLIIKPGQLKTLLLKAYEHAEKVKGTRRDHPRIHELVGIMSDMVPGVLDDTISYNDFVKRANEVAPYVLEFHKLYIGPVKLAR